MGTRIELFKLFGFPVRIDISWFFLALLITWSLAVGFFPFVYQDLPTSIYWLMGVAGALGLFVSIIVHEFCHSIVARHFGLPMGGITLFIFGGIAEMEDEPPSPRVEFLMGAAGPAASFVIALLFFGITAVGEAWGWSVIFTGVTSYLATINALLAAFNLIPAFPLDGGRLLRAVLWAVKDNIRWATRISSQIGAGFGLLLIVLGVVGFIGGNFIGGVWFVLIGLFIRNAASSSYQQLLFRRILEGVPVKRFMQEQVVTVPPEATLHDVVEDYFYRHYFKLYPVVQADGELLGYITLNQVKEHPREEWDTLKVRDVMQPLSPDITVPPTTDALQAINVLNRTGGSRLLVTDNSHLVGILSIRDLMHYLSLKSELQEYTPPRRIGLSRSPSPR